VYSDNVAKMVQELLGDLECNVYYVDQTPSFDIAKNYDAFLVWDIEEQRPMHCTEGTAISGSGIILNFDFMVTVYGNRLTNRNTLIQQVLDILQPIVSGRRTPLQQHQLTNGFIRYMVWSSETEFPIPKSAQSNAEMSASVLMFNTSISVTE
jgi:hypothetical protein